MNANLKNHLRTHAPVTAARLLWLMSRLVRTKIVGFDQVRKLGRVNFAHWHGDELALFPWFGKVNAAILVSPSKDGEMMAKAAAHAGYHIVRGSSTRGGVGAMVALIKASRQGYHCAIAVDGPKGPLHVCKPGIVRLSQKGGAPLLPVGVAVNRKYTFERTWNKTYIPLPLSSQILFFGEPLCFGPEKDADALDKYCQAVQMALHAAQLTAMDMLREWKDPR